MSCHRNRFLLVLFKKVREEGEVGWVLIRGGGGREDFYSSVGACLRKDDI